MCAMGKRFCWTRSFGRQLKLRYGLLGLLSTVVWSSCGRIPLQPGGRESVAKKRVPSRRVPWLISPREFMGQRTRQIRPGGFEAAAFLLLVLLLTFFVLCETRAANLLEPGLAVTFATADKAQPKTSDVAVLPN